NGTVTQHDLVEQAQADRNESATWMNDFKRSIDDDFDSRGYRDTAHPVKWLLHGVVIAVLVGAGLLFGLAFDAPFGWTPLVIASSLLVLTLLLRKRTVKGARAIAQVTGLRRFLKDFSRLGDESHAGDFAIYE